MTIVNPEMGTHIARYETDRIDEATATIDRFWDPSSGQFFLTHSVEAMVDDRIRQGARFPHGVLATLNKAFASWVRDREAQSIIDGWKVPITLNGDEYRPGTCVDHDGESIPTVMFLPLAEGGALHAKTGDLFAAVAHHSLDTYEYKTCGCLVNDQNPCCRTAEVLTLVSTRNGFHGIIRTYATLDQCQEDRNALAQAVKLLTREARTSDRPDQRQAKPQKAPDLI